MYPPLHYVAGFYFVQLLRYGVGKNIVSSPIANETPKRFANYARFAFSPHSYYASKTFIYRK